MQTKQLIAQLQKLVDEWEPCVAEAGEHEIVIDVFEECGNHKFEYKGFSPHIVIEKSADGVYDIISAFKESTNGL